MERTEDNPGAFVVIDLDNQLDYKSGHAEHYPAGRMKRLLDEIERCINKPISSGFAAMNDRTKEAMSTGALKLLSARRIEVKTVPAKPEEADKFLFWAMGGIRRRFPCVVVVSTDRGFADAVRNLRACDPTVELYVAVHRVSHSLREHYKSVEGVTFIELQPKRNRSPRLELIGTGGPVAVDYVLICGNCGRRSKHRSAETKGLCEWCGGLLRTDPESSLILPHGKCPFTDGPVVELWFQGVHRRTAVLCEQTTYFVREFDPRLSYAQIALGDLVDKKDEISRKQFFISAHGDGRYVLVRPLKEDKKEPRKMYLGAEMTPILVDQGIELLDGQVFWVNELKPEKAEQAGAVLQCCFRRDGCVGVARGRA